ncbi:hypothetical protein Tco_0794012 [Tanacetum coccineum]
MCLLTTSESSIGDSSSESSAGPSRKRCRPLAATMTSSIHASRSLVPSRVDLLPITRDIQADALTIEVAADIDVKAEVDACIGIEVDVRVDVEDKVEGEGEVESSDRGTMEVGVDIVTRIDIPDGMLMPDDVKHLEQLEVGSLIAGGDFASLLDQITSLERSTARLRGTLMMESIMTITRSSMTPEAIEELINQRVAEALAAYEVNRAGELAVESQSQNGDDDDNENVGGNGNRNWGNGDEKCGGNGNRNKGGNGNGIPIGMIEELKKFALTWWNAYKRTIGIDAAFSMSCRELMKLRTEAYCPRNEIQKIESEL